MASTGGQAKPRGEVRADKDPEAGPRRGARFEDARVTARLDGDGLTVRISGMATYGARTAAQSFDVTDDTGDLERAMTALLERHRPAIEAHTLEAAYEAAALARRLGED